MKRNLGNENTYGAENSGKFSVTFKVRTISRPVGFSRLIYNAILETEVIIFRPDSVGAIGNGLFDGFPGVTM